MLKRMTTCVAQNSQTIVKDEWDKGDLDLKWGRGGLMMLLRKLDSNLVYNHRYCTVVQRAQTIGLCWSICTSIHTCIGFPLLPGSPLRQYIKHIKGMPRVHYEQNRRKETVNFLLHVCNWTNERGRNSHQHINCRVKNRSKKEGLNFNLFTRKVSIKVYHVKYWYHIYLWFSTN